MQKIAVTSRAFKDGAMMPKKYTCDGEEISPPLEWSGVPSGTKSIAILSDDPDAPAGTWIHWIVFNIPPETKGMPEGVPHDEVLADGARQGVDTSGNIGYGSPCPPSGTHRYYFKVYALDTKMDLRAGANLRGFEEAMKGHVLAEGQIMGRYSRGR